MAENLSLQPSAEAGQLQFDALRELTTPPKPPKRPIWFVTPEDKSKKGQARSKA